MNQNEKCVNLHTHSNKSDGVLSPRELVIAAIKNNNAVLSITDHNMFLPKEEFEALQEEFKDQIRLVQGIEASMSYETSEGIEKEIHAVVLFTDPEKVKFLGERQMDRKGYITAIRGALLKCDIEIPTYEELQKEHPDSKCIGRKHVADWMYRHGITESVDEAFDLYIGQFGEKRAYVPIEKFKKKDCSMQEKIRRIREEGGNSIIAIVLCHLYYYRLPEEERFRLCKEFKKAAGPLAAIETIYHGYSEEQEADLKMIAKKLEMMESAATDYHGQSETDSLYINAPVSAWEKIEKPWLERCKKQ